MDPRDWYAGLMRRIGAAHIRSPGTCAVVRRQRLETDHPTAVEIAYKSVRRRMRRERDSATGWKSC